MLFFYSSYRELKSGDRKNKLIAETTALYREISDLENEYFEKNKDNEGVTKARAIAQLMAFQHILKTLHEELTLLIPQRKGAKPLPPDLLLPYMKRLLALLLYYQEHQKNITPLLPYKNIDIDVADFINKSVNALGLIWACFQTEKNHERLMYPAIMVLGMIAGGLVAALVLGVAAPYLIAGVLAGAAVGFIVTLCIQKHIDYKLANGTLSLDEDFLTESKTLWSEKFDVSDRSLNEAVDNLSHLIKDKTNVDGANVLGLIAKEMQWIKDSVPGSKDWVAPKPLK